MDKLTYFRERCSKHFKCDYCFNTLDDEYFSVVTTDDKIISFFGFVKTSYSQKKIHLCKECFGKLHELLEDILQEGWTVLEDENLDDDLEGEMELGINST